MSNFRKYYTSSKPLSIIMLLSGIAVITDNSLLIDIAIVLTFLYTIITLIHKIDPNFLSIRGVDTTMKKYNKRNLYGLFSAITTLFCLITMLSSENMLARKIGMIIVVVLLFINVILMVIDIKNGNWIVKKEAKEEK